MVLAPLVALLLALVTPVTPGPILTDVPGKPDPAARYVFYLHGRILETQGREAVSPEFGAYRYDAILTALAAHRLTVISEVRRGDAGQEFVDKVAGQVRRLRAAGVPACHIGIVGASKGGGFTVRLAAALQEPDMSFVVLAGCSSQGPSPLAAELRGRVLSIYDRRDSLGPSCAPTFASAPQLTAKKEIVLDLDKGHGLLYEPYPEWVIPAVNWIHEGARR
jgi:dienelactone hydrolase